MFKHNNIISNQYNAKLLQRVLLTAFSVFIMFLFVFNAAAVNAQPIQNESLSNSDPIITQDGATGAIYSKTIKWADSTTETVQVGKDGFIILNGTKSRLVGAFISATGMPYGKDGQFYLAQNLAIYDKELAYLESVGVRVVHICLDYVRWPGWANSLEEEKAAYKSIMDLFYKHKMLAVPQISMKSMSNFKSLQNPDFTWEVFDANMKYLGTDSAGTFTKRWAETVCSYPNVIGVVLENELDYPWTAADAPWDPDWVDQKYGVTEITNYLNFLHGIVEQYTTAPVLHKLIGTWMANLDFKAAAMKATDIAAVDCYARSATEMNTRMSSLTTWLGSSGFSKTGWWAMEVANGWPGTNINDFNVDYVKAIFNNGGTLACLFPSNWTGSTSIPLFSDAGEPVAKLKEIAQQIPALQAPISTTPVDQPAASGYTLASLTVTNGGSGYTSTPTVTISGGNGTGAAAVAVIGKKIESISVTNGGRDYTTAPKVIITGGGGSGATAVAKVQPGTGARAIVLSVTVTNGGSGYTSAPTVTFQSPSGSRASAQAVLSSGIVTKLTLTNPGAGYTTAPTVTINGGGGSGATATATLAGSTTTTPPSTTVIEGELASIKVTSGGVYKSVPTIVISGGGGTGAKAIANISRSGSRYTVTSVTITNPGSGYTSAPTVTFSAGGGGGAIATATIK